jgi:hypothetical protein
MATTQIADVVVPEVFSAYTLERAAELSLLVRSGVIARNPALDGFLAGGGDFITMPKWNDLDDTAANISSDQSASATPVKATTHRELAIRNNRNQSWSQMDLTAQLAGADAMSMIVDRVANYWVRQDQIQLNSVIEGLLLSDTALLNAIEAADGDDAVDGNRVSGNAFLDTFQLMGDHKNQIAAIAVHSAVHTQLQKNNLIDFVAESEANVGFGTFFGKTLIVDDGLLVTTDTDASAASKNIYHSVCFGQGAFQYGVGSPRVATAVTREELRGNGAGEEILTNRREYVLHPAGYTVATDVAAGVSPTNAELSVGTAYTRVGLRKNVPLAVLRSN